MLLIVVLLSSVGRNQGGGICRDKGKDRGKDTRKGSTTDDRRKWGTGKICRYHYCR